MFIQASPFPAALLDYAGRYGHCNVPDKWTQNFALSGWVGNQRQFKKRGKLSKERMDRLERIGFVWNPRDAAWEAMYTSLADFKSKHGHCNVPQKWEANRSLGVWVNTQRNRRNRLKKDRVDRLTRIGLL